MPFYAHSTGRLDKQDWQPLASHLLEAGNRAAANAAMFGASALAEAAGRLHDLGKYTHEFQRRLSGDFHRVDHATWGARIAKARYGPPGTLIAYAIAGHHAGLANGQHGHERTPLNERLSEEYREACLPSLLPDWENEIPLPENLELPTGFKPLRPRVGFQFSLLARMIFSCLVDADYIDTDNFYRHVEGREPRTENAGPSLQILRDRLDAHLASLPKEGGINPLRARILSHVREKAIEAPGLFSLTVPTGGGKTLASLAFALDHALAHGLRRVIYVVPFTSIIEQTAAVFRSAFGEYGQEAVLEHHSAYVDDPNSQPQAREKREHAMENWDAPVIVTTSVQFFESLAADRPSRCRKLHNIAASVVILDEAQTLPLPLLRPCVQLIDELALNYHASLVLCTATQPALRKEDGFTDGLENVRELAPEPRHLYEQLRRVTVRHAGKLDDAALAEKLRACDQALCIVNNRQHARTLFQSIADLPGALHLTTLMHARHRSRVLDTVRARLRAGEPCRLVSTSLVEAGVDVSFPTVLRAEAGLDSIAQAAGRCNRNGERPAHDSQVLVFSTPDWKPPRELEQFAGAFRAIERQHRNDLLALEAIKAYFQEIYWRKDGKLGDDVLALFKGIGIEDLPLESLATRFRMIETRMRPVIVPYDPFSDRPDKEDPEAEEALRELQQGGSVSVAARKLQTFLVQIPEQAYQALWQAYAIAPVAADRYGEQFVRLVNALLYDAQFGLHWEDPHVRDAESNIL